MRFLGMVGCYHTSSFYPNFSTVVALLTYLLGKKAAFVWSPLCNSTFTYGKELLHHSPVLATPKFDKPFKIQVDTGGIGAGAVLQHEIDLPVCFTVGKNPLALI